MSSGVGGGGDFHAGKSTVTGVARDRGLAMSSDLDEALDDVSAALTVTTGVLIAPVEKVAGGMEH